MLNSPASSKPFLILGIDRSDKDLKQDCILVKRWPPAGRRCEGRGTARIIVAPGSEFVVCDDEGRQEHRQRGRIFVEGRTSASKSGVSLRKPCTALADAEEKSWEDLYLALFDTRVASCTGSWDDDVVSISPWPSRPCFAETEYVDHTVLIRAGVPDQTPLWRRSCSKTSAHSPGNRRPSAASVDCPLEGVARRTICPLAVRLLLGPGQPAEGFGEYLWPTVPPPAQNIHLRLAQLEYRLPFRGVPVQCRTAPPPPHRVANWPDHERRSAVGCGHPAENSPAPCARFARA